MKLIKSTSAVDVFKYLDNAFYVVADGYLQISETTVDNAASLWSYEVQRELWELLRDVSEGMSLHPNPDELRENLQFIAAKLDGGYADKIVRIFEVDSNRIPPAMPQKTISFFQDLMREALPMGRNIQDIHESGDVDLLIGMCFLQDKETREFSLLTKSELVLADALSFCLFNLLVQASNSPKKEMQHEWQAAIFVISSIIGAYFSKRLNLK